MRKILSILLILGFLLAPGQALAKAKKKAAPEPPKRTQRQERQLRKNITVDPRKVTENRDLRKNVKHNGGFVWIQGVPMYDQGSRPECAIAVVKRLLDYYASHNNVDMRNLRNALGYRPEFGTNLGFMIRAIQQYSSRLRLKFQGIYDFQMTQDDLALYNRNVKDKQNKGKLDHNVLDWAQFVKNLEFPAWRQMRSRDHDRRKAWTALTRAIDQGIPVVWGVYLGLITEQHRKQNSGGHLRMIIGYNSSKQMIYYTDSWGKGHERKSMSWDNAWGITWHLFVLEPMN